MNDEAEIEWHDLIASNLIGTTVRKQVPSEMRILGTIIETNLVENEMTVLVKYNDGTEERGTLADLDDRLVFAESTALRETKREYDRGLQRFQTASDLAEKANALCGALKYEAARLHVEAEVLRMRL